MSKVKVPDEKKLDDFYIKIRKKFANPDKKVTDAPEDGNVLRKFLTFMITFPDIVHLLIKLLFDKEVPPENKGALFASAVYLISPIDIIPDAVPAYGYVDDLIIIVIALNKFMDSSDPSVKAAIDRHWAGDQDAYETVDHIMKIIESTVEFLPQKLSDVIRKTLQPLDGKNS